MFYVLALSAIPFAAELPTVVDFCAAVDGVNAKMARAQVTHPGDQLQLVEVLYASSAAMPKIPPELARAAAAWNAMADRVRPKLPKVRAIGNYVGPYRRWCKKAIDRKYLLEDVVASAERRQDWHNFITLGWLLGSKEGTLNSDKLLDDRGMTKQRRTRPANDDEFTGEEK